MCVCVLFLTPLELESHTKDPVAKENPNHHLAQLTTDSKRRLERFSAFTQKRHAWTLSGLPIGSRRDSPRRIHFNFVEGMDF
ncbi:hypothetical protein CEXT_796911 [Caerostris extrusa]|uniref:Uncharacterized protein n=1 Tax=Caerostris extrusa TaxID=172846 RepID=A0AAV4X9I4_CAEEX|nr:hypothetical protein CEXT_796911 [Caerostris extrusa]